MRKDGKNALVFYVVIAFGVTWLCWMVAILLGYQEVAFLQIVHSDFDSPRQQLLFFVFRLGSYGPLIASVVVTFWWYGSKGLKDLWQRITNWNVQPKWYLLLVLIPLGINLSALLVGALMEGSFRPFIQHDIPLSLLLVFFLWQIFTSGMEEPGWRGFALVRLQEKYTAEKASWVLGILWAIWHFPLLVVLYAGEGIFPLLFSLAGFTMVMIGQTLIYTWLYNHTQSVFVAILYHAWGNTATAFIFGTVATHNPTIGILTGVATWALAFLLLKKFGSQLRTHQ